MSNYIKKEFCKVCKKETDHAYLDNTPTEHRYTIQCLGCNLRTLEEIFFKKKK